MTKILDALNWFVWGIPALILILTVGVVLSVRTRWAQFRLFPTAIKSLFSQLRSDKDSGNSSYRALCTALGATVGTGNLAGVAGAIAIGGPGSIFWMWICGLLGMVTKFAEAALSVRYRVPDGNGGYMGGPMYMVQRGMGKCWQFLGGIYCFFGVVAAFGVGSATQINAVLGGINGAVKALGGEQSFLLDLLIGIALAVFIVCVLFGGAKRIGTAAAFLVPFASVFYMLLGIGVLALRASAIPAALSAIVWGAFSPQAVTGGVVGSMFQALRIGTSRGVFTNEAGMGTAGIAHGAANVDHPVQQGLMGIIEVFLDTIVICTITALVILCSGAPIPYGKDLGIEITANAFSHVYGPWVHIPMAIALCLFAVATIVGWGLYGARCAQYLFGSRSWKWFVVFQAFSVLLGAVLSTGTVWTLSETANGLMAIPNLIILIYLHPELVRLVNEYQLIYGRKHTIGGSHENINQRKSMRTFSHAKVPSAGSESKGRGKENLPFEYWSA